MSRRKRRSGAAPQPSRGPARDAEGRPATTGGRGARPAGAGVGGGYGARAGRRSSRPPAVDLAVLVAVFAVTTGIAALAGAANLGVALGIGQVAFAIALVVLLLRD